MKIVKVLMTMLFAVIVNSVFAYDFEVGGIYYNILSASDKTCEVTSGDKEYTGDVIIPSTVQYNNRTLIVRSIKSKAFEYCDELTSVVIGDSVKTIGDYAFSKCSGLSSITIPNSVMAMGEYAFYNCDNLRSASIGSGITSIGSHAFCVCHSLTSVIISNGINSIGESAFSSCPKLASITIPNSVFSIGESAFEECSSLSSVTIGDGVTSVGNRCFYNCSNLSNVSLGSNVKSIGVSAFEGCSNLTLAQLPNSVTKVGECAFRFCKNLISVDFPDGLDSINYQTFYGCGFINIIIPSSITYIGEEAFYDCQNIQQLTIPSSVTEMVSYYERSGMSPHDVYPFEHCHPRKATFGSFYVADKVSKDSMTTLTLMEDVSDFSGYEFERATKLDTLISRATTPPTINHVTENQKASLKVFVPKGTLTAYQAADVWKEFWNLQEGDGTSGISPVTSHSDAAKEIERFMITGEKADGKVPGINIIRMSDGTTRKVIVK